MAAGIFAELIEHIQRSLEDALDVDIQIILGDIFHGKEAIGIADFPRIFPVLKRAKAQGQVFARQHLAQGLFVNPKGKCPRTLHTLRRASITILIPTITSSIPQQKS